MARHASPLDALLIRDDFDGDVYPGELLGKHTSYHIGGAARFFVRVDSIHALTALLDACAAVDMPWVIIGKGTNLLVADEGYDGVVIVLGRDFKNHRVDGQTHVLSSGAAVSLSAVVQEAFHRSMAGLEFAVGTPGSVGGAICMNAGSGTTWIGERVVSVTTYHPQRGLRRYRGSQVTWEYRHTSFDPQEIVLECEIALEPADPFAVRSKMDSFLAKRRQTQPLQLPSCGSVFKNPPGQSAGALIDGLGLKGFTVGGAQVSDVHANFIVNTGSATAADVKAVIGYIKTAVWETHGVALETEVRFLGF